MMRTLITFAALMVLHTGAAAGQAAGAAATDAPAAADIGCPGYNFSSGTVVADVTTGTMFSSEPLRVTRVEPGGPAEAAGIRANDRIIAVDGVDVTSIDRVAGRLGGAAGTSRLLLLQRDDQTLEVRHVTGRREANPAGEPQFRCVPVDARPGSKR